MIHAALPVAALALMTKPSSTPVCCEPPPAAWNWSSGLGSSPTWEARWLGPRPAPRKLLRALDHAPHTPCPKPLASLANQPPIGPVCCVDMQALAWLQVRVEDGGDGVVR